VKLTPEDHQRLHTKLNDRPPHSPTPVRVLTVHRAFTVRRAQKQFPSSHSPQQPPGLVKRMDQGVAKDGPAGDAW
jgi:hypothetical protein